MRWISWLAKKQCSQQVTELQTKYETINSVPYFKYVGEVILERFSQEGILKTRKSQRLGAIYLQ